MKALTPQLSAPQVCNAAEVSLLISTELLNIPSPGTLLPFHDARFCTVQFGHRRRRRTALRSHSATRSRASSGTQRAVRGSRFARTLPDRLGRIEFTLVTDCSFVSGCSPPFLLKTQLPSTTRLYRMPRSGLSPDNSIAFTGARAGDVSPLSLEASACGIKYVLSCRIT